MYTKYFGALVVLCLLVIHAHGRPEPEGSDTSSTTEATTWDKIKKGVEHGWQVVHDESHCAFHKVKELVKHHDHDDGSDPCVNKPYQQTTTSTSTTQESIVLVVEDQSITVQPFIG